MGKAKKSTIKFQKKHLKETIERRRQHSKVRKQIAKRKERQKLREAQNDNSDKNKKNDSKKEQEVDESPQSQVNVSDFFCSFAIDPEESLDLSDDEEADLDPLDQFDAPDPEELEAEGALEDDNEDDVMKEEESADEEDGSQDEEFMSEDEEEQEEDEEEEEEEEDHGDATAVTIEMLQKWSEAARKKQPSALKELLKAFRSIARSEEENTQCTYYVNSHKVYSNLVKITIKSAYPIFSDHIVTSKKVRHPAKTKNWQKLEKVVRLYLNNCVRFLRDLQQSDLVTYILTHLEPCSVYFGCFPKPAREYLRVLLDRWSDITLSSEARAQCHKALRRFATDAVDVQKRSYLAHTLKGVYMTFAKKVTKVTESNISLVEQMMQEAADIYTIEPKGSFQHADVYIRQLSNHMKTAKKTRTVEAFKEIYNWQFISCLDFWAAVVGATCNPETGTNSPMQNIVKPLVDLCLNTMRLNPTAQFVPLRVHIVRTLINLIDSTGFYIPLGPFTLELFDSQILKAPAEDSDLEEFNWQVYLKTPSEYAPTKVYRDAMFQAYYDNVVDFYGCFGLSIAFPELVIPVLSKLKEESRRLKNSRFFKPLKTLIEKFEMHKNYIEQKRAPIEYSATKLEQVNAFLRNTSFETTPLGSFIANKNSR